MWSVLLGDDSDDDVAVRVGETKVRRGQLRREAEAIADALAGQGVDENSSVLIRLAPGLDFVRYLLATMALQAQPVIVDHRLPAHVVSQVAQRCGAWLDVASAAPMSVAAGFTTAPTELTRIGGPGRRSDHALVQLSSGTTDAPKLAGRCTADVMDEITRYRQLGGLAPPGAEVIAACALASAWGVYAGIVGALANRHAIVLPDSPTPQGIMNAVARSRGPAVVLAVPIHVAMLARLKTAPPQLHRVLSSGGPLSAETARPLTLAERYIPVGQVYGTTETGMIAADPLGEAPGTVGYVAPALRTRLAPAGAPAHEGELDVAMAASPYLDPALATGRWKAGWFRTRDAVAVDGDGRLRVRGRADGLVSAGGWKFHVAEVEHHLARDDAIVEAVVLTDGPHVEAFVQPAHGSVVDLPRVLQGVPPYMRPQRVHVVQALPRGPSGKALRHRDLLTAAAGTSG